MASRLNIEDSLRKVGFVYHDDYLKHLTGSDHPERPERLSHLIDHLKSADVFSKLVNIPATPAKVEWIERVHPKSYIESIENSCKSGLHFLDSDTVVCEDSYNVALLAAGGLVAACESVMNGEVDRAFCAVRPPGHHAEPNKPMGFCLFNNVAVAARYLQDRHSIKRVCIIDWDVHHGNGTQAAFYDDPSVFYISLHQHPLYPGTGRADETGDGAAKGTTLNFPLPPGCGDKEYLDIFENQVRVAVINFKPEFMLISAGFDAHRDDPLANMELTETGFREMTEFIMKLVDECCSGRLVSVLEGGYNLQALALSVEEHLKIMVD